MSANGRGLDLSLPLADALKRALLHRLWADTIPAGACRVWVGYLRNGQHGALSIHNRPVYVHQLSYAIHLGPVPAGRVVCHTCDVPPCWLPGHLFLGSQLDNVADMRAKGRGVNPPVIRGVAHHLVTRSDEVVAEARRLRAAGIEQREVARRLGVAQSTVWRWAHHRTRAEAG